MDFFVPVVYKSHPRTRENNAHTGNCCNLFFFSFVLDRVAKIIIFLLISNRDELDSFELFPCKLYTELFFPFLAHRV